MLPSPPSSPSSTIDAKPNNGTPLPPTTIKSLPLHTPPSSTDLLNQIPAIVFQTPLHLFDAPTSALSHLPSDADRCALDTELISRREMVDLQRDAVNDALAHEVRIKGPELLAGMHQIQELDLDVTRTYLATRAARRRLANAQENYYEASLKVSELASTRQSTSLVHNLVSTLVEAYTLYRGACDTSLTIENRAGATLHALDWLQSALENPVTSNLSALTCIQARLKEHIPNLIEQVDQEFFLVMCHAPLSKDDFQTLTTCISRLHPGISLLNKVGDTTKAIIQSLFSYSNETTTPSLLLLSHASPSPSPPEAQTADTTTSTTEQTMFQLVVDCLSAHIAAEDTLLSPSSPEATSTSKLERRRAIWAVVEECCLARLRRPEARTLTLDGFRALISHCEILVVVGRGFCLGDAKATLQLSGAIKQRANAFALQFQAEGFEAMRGFLSRETWFKFANNSGATAQSILSRLDKKVIPLVSIRITSWRERDTNPFLLRNEGESTGPTASAAPMSITEDSEHDNDTTPTITTTPSSPVVLTATTASGLPRQMARTAELIRKLPGSAGVAYQGLQRAFDVYMVSMWSLFVHDKMANGDHHINTVRSPAFAYISSSREGLREWFSSTSDTDNGDVVAVIRGGALDYKFAWRHALVAAASLDFFGQLAEIAITSMDETLPTVEGSKLTSRTRDMMACIPDMKRQLCRACVCDLIDLDVIDNGILDVDWEEEIPGNQGNAYVTEALRMAKEMWVTLMRNASFDDDDSTMAVSTGQDSSYPLSMVPNVFDEACCMLIDCLVDSWAKVDECSASGRVAMAFDLAALCSGLDEITGQSGDVSTWARGKHRARAKAFVEAYYLDREEDLTSWIKSKRGDLSIKQLMNVVETGMFGRSSLGKRRMKDVKAVIERGG